MFRRNLKINKKYVVLIGLIILMCILFNVFMYKNISQDRTLSVNVEKIKRVIKRVNLLHEVLNTDTFGYMTEDTTTIVVLVHTDIQLVRSFINAIAQVGNIDEALLVFSHSFYDENINNLVKSIRFCRILQLFNPYSPQFRLKNLYNGDDSLANMNDMEVLQKQHWWWTAGQVFDHMPWSRANKEYIIFVQVSDLLAPDVLYIYDYLQYVAKANTSNIEIIGLGTTREDSFEEGYGLAIKRPWSVAHSRGIAFDRKLWREIVGLRRDYCTFDDSSWSRSLMNVFLHRTRGVPLVLVLKVPRVVDSRMGGSKLRWIADKMGFGKRIWANNKMYPQEFSLVSTDPMEEETVKYESNGLGGWTDPRIILLCMGAVDPTAEYAPSGYTLPMFNNTSH